jgi:hypothetical protein
MASNRRSPRARMLLIGLGSALLVSGSVHAHAEESESLTLQIPVTAVEPEPEPEPEPDPCTFAPIAPRWAPTWNSGTGIFPETLAGSRIFDVIMLSFTPGTDTCGEAVAQDGTVQASFVTPTPFTLETPTLDCETPCNAATTGNIDVEFNIPADTPTDTYSVGITVTWTPIS